MTNSWGRNRTVDLSLMRGALLPAELPSQIGGGLVPPLVPTDTRKVATEITAQTCPSNARPYECRSPVASPRSIETKRGAQRSAAADCGGRVSATHSAKNLPVERGAARPDCYSAAQGRSTSMRTRTTKLLEIFDWCWPYIEPVLSGKLPAALVFDGMDERRVLEVHHAVVASLKLERSTLHDWRHTHLVLALKAGYPPIGLARQAGHKDTNLLWTRYGKHIPELSELVPRAIAAPKERAAK